MLKQVDHAVASLRALGDLDRAQAARLLATWRYSPELSRRERAAVLARFPEQR